MDFSLADSAGTTIKGTSIADRDYFQQAIATQDAYMSSPILRKTSQTVAFMMGKYFSVNGRAYVVYGALSDDTISKFISKVHYEENSIAFVIDKTGVVVGSNTSLIEQMTELCGDHKLGDSISKAAAKILQGTKGSVSFKLSGTDYIAGYAQIESPEGWYVVTATPVQPIKNSILVAALAIIAIALISTVVAAVISIIRIRQIAEPVAATAQRMQDMANGTTTQASAIEEISATIQDVSSHIAATAGSALQAGSLSEQTQEKVNYQDSEIQNMVRAMTEIRDTSREIEKIIKTIEDIAFQTNILALNAAVEAARAGAAGKGFAVVADEVRNLANKSQEAAKSTSALITAAISAVGKGSEIADATAESMKEVKDMSAQTAELIVSIASASREQSEAIKQITAGVDQISSVIQTNSATAEETAALCNALNGQSKMLQDQVARFKLET